MVSSNFKLPFNISVLYVMKTQRNAPTDTNLTAIMSVLPIHSTATSLMFLKFTVHFFSCVKHHDSYSCFLIEETPLLVSSRSLSSTDDGDFFQFRGFNCNCENKKLF